MNKFFSQTQMAAALAIVKNVPENLSLKEFVSRLCKAISPNSSSVQSPPKRHIDTCDFWKDLYESCHKDNQELRSKIRIEEERQRIFQRARSLVHNENAISRKRPLGLEEVEDWIENEEGSEPVGLLSDDYLRLSSNTIRIGKHRRNLEKITKDSEIPEHIDTLATSACRFLNLLDKALSECLLPIWQLKCNNTSQTVLLLQQLMHQVTLGYFASFEALNEIAETIPGRKKRFDVTHRLVSFFRTALGHLNSVSTLQNELESDMTGRPNKKRLKKEVSEYAVNKYLTKTLVQICQIDWKTGMLGHHEILEGILCGVLSHTGHLLSHLCFKEHVAGSEKQGNISMGIPSSRTVATKFEFRYIIPILHAALGGNSKKDLIAKILAQRKGRAGDTNGDMIWKAKKKMQEQLVKSAIGSDTEGFEWLAPPETAEVYTTEANAEQYESEWFLQSVWALVGWELAITATESNPKSA